MLNSINRVYIAFQRHGIIGMARVIIKRIIIKLKIRIKPSFRNQFEECKKRCETFDKQYGVITCGFIHHTRLKVNNKNKIHAASYFGSDPKYFREVIYSLAIDYSSFYFIDFGSGMGRVILLATEFPFYKITGVEFSYELHKIALDNIERFNRNIDRTRIESVCIDAVFFQLPINPLVCYFFNPFDATIMSQVIFNIKKSLLENPRIVFIVYLNPIEGNLFDQSDCFRRIGAIGQVCIWRTTPETECNKRV